MYCYKAIKFLKSVAESGKGIFYIIYFIFTLIPVALAFAGIKMIIDTSDNFNPYFCLLFLPLLIEIVVMICYKTEKSKRRVINLSIRLVIFGKEELEPDNLPTFAENYDFFSIKHKGRYSSNVLPIYWHMKYFDNSYQDRVISNYAYAHALNPDDFMCRRFLKIEEAYRVCSQYITHNEKEAIRKEILDNIDPSYDEKTKENWICRNFDIEYGKRLAVIYLEGIKKDYAERKTRL